VGREGNVPGLVLFERSLAHCIRAMRLISSCLGSRKQIIALTTRDGAEYVALLGITGFLF
jgi:hypothetical protein